MQTLAVHKLYRQLLFVVQDVPMAPFVPDVVLEVVSRHLVLESPMIPDRRRRRKRGEERQGASIGISIGVNDGNLCCADRTKSVQINEKIIDEKNVMSSDERNAMHIS